MKHGVLDPFVRPAVVMSRCGALLLFIYGSCRICPDQLFEEFCYGNEIHRI